jgi:hypothetical protein
MTIENSNQFGAGKDTTDLKVIPFLSNFFISSSRPYAIEPSAPILIELSFNEREGSKILEIEFINALSSG